jgi:hypothetical protein
VGTLLQVIGLVFVLVSIIFLVLLALYRRFFLHKAPSIGARSESRYGVPVVIDQIVSSTSISFYTIAGASQKALKPDLRGKFWEFQLEYFTGNYSTHYLSDGPLSVNGIDFLVLPEGSDSYEDSQFCIRTPETWRHFMKFNSQMKWYFRGTHDTFVNLTGLVHLIHELESKSDPMTSYNFAFNFHEYGNTYYPHGGTGWLFSNYAVKQFLAHVDQFDRACRATFDDVALPFFFRDLGLDVMDYQTNKFIVTWPNHLLDVVYQKQWHRVRSCPETYSLYRGGKGLKPARAREAASIHMHRVPMDEAWTVLSLTPTDIGVYFPDPNVPTFCRLEN